jgi:glutamate--cysteine ligase
LYQALATRLQKLLDSGKFSTLCESRIGLEKESLRVSAAGSIAQTAHPAGLGAALTNPYITTDFSEALTEMITPPCDSVAQVLEFLGDIEKFVCMNIEDEVMWASSMPCVVEGGDSIPVADYGSSNIGMMKKIYRRGLGYRYGRTMQVIAGVHFNYSFSDNFWRAYQLQENTAGDDLQSFKTGHYMGQVRNILRYGWLIPYLFGASPAVCKSFLHGKPTMLSSFSRGTAYEEHATSLRMGNIGYTNNKESLSGIKANYNTVDDYVSSLDHAIRTPFDEYEAIGVEAEGEYRQLSANILQIENEYYSTVRPKQIPDNNEMPIHALRDRGIEYVELRSLDINVFDPLGVDAAQLYFLEVFMLFCLLQHSPTLNESEVDEIDMNLIQVAHNGRQPGMMLTRDDEPVSLQDWASSLCTAMRPVAELLDRANDSDDYSTSLAVQHACVDDASRTPSARILRSMREHDEEYFHFAKRKALEHQQYFCNRELSEERMSLFRQAAAESIAKQKQIEAQDGPGFAEFLQQYYAQH